MNDNDKLSDGPAAPVPTNGPAQMTDCKAFACDTAISISGDAQLVSDGLMTLNTPKLIEMSGRSKANLRNTTHIAPHASVPEPNPGKPQED